MVFRRSCCWLSMPTWTHPSEGTKTTRSAETDDFDIERKTFNDKIRTLDNEHQRLEKLYHDRHIDTCTRRQKDHDKDRYKTVDDTSRNNSHQRDVTRPTRQGVVTKNNRNRQQVDDHESTDDETEMTTNLDD
jgi:hypothetical protein